MKQFYTYCIYLILMGSSVAEAASEDVQEKIRLAEAFVESGDLLEGREIYQDLMQESLEPWERAVIIYNIGTVLLAEKSWKQARESFQAVPLDNQLRPVLHYRIQHNLALIDYREAVDLLTEEPERSVALLQKTLEQITVAEQAHCELIMAEGAPSCRIREELSTLKQLAQYQLARAFQEKTTHLIQQTSIQEGIPILLKGVKESQEHLNFLETHASMGDLGIQYRELFGAEGKAWMPLWDVLEKKLQDNKKDESRLPKWQALYSEAKQEYTQGIAKLEQNSLPDSHVALEKSEEALQELAKLLPPVKKSPRELPENPSEEKPVEENKEQKEAEQILQNLQQMEQQDYTPKEQKLKTTELRPW